MPWPMRLGPPPRITTLRAVGRRRLVLVLVGRVEVGRVGLELGGAGVDQLEDGADARAPAARARTSASVRPASVGDAPVGEAQSAWPRRSVARRSASPPRAISSSNSTISRMLSRNHGIDPGQLVDLVASPARAGSASPIAKSRSGVRDRGSAARSVVEVRRRPVERRGPSGPARASAGPSGATP